MGFLPFEPLEEGGGLPLPSGTPANGDVPAVSQVSPLELEWVSGEASAVDSVFGRIGAVVAVSGDYTVSQVTGAAPVASPEFTGTPTGPTAAPGTNTTQLATTAFVEAALPSVPSLPLALTNGGTGSSYASLALLLAGLLAAGGGTMGGALAPAVVTLAQAGGTVAVNAGLGNAFNLTIGGSWTISNPSNPADGQVIRFRFTSGGANVTSWDTDYDFGAGTAPALSVTASDVDIVAFEYVASISKWCCLGSGLGY